MQSPRVRRAAIAACLVFSGLTALVYQILWVRLLGFTFGTTTEAVSTVLAVFFGGLALGNLLAARGLARVTRPLRVYAWLELGIGLWALASLPALRALDGVHALLGVGQGPLAQTLLRFAASAVVLLPPTVAMGATLPVVARGLVTDDATLGRWSALLYAANTLGAVLGAYLCGFWLLPGLGLSRSVLAAGLVNLAVAVAVLATAGGLRVPVPGPPPPAGAAARPQAFFLLFFGVSGFVAIGYEVVWSKVFGIVMEGTLYGFAAVLSAFLLGIAAGSALVAGVVDRIRDLPRAFGWLHAAIAVSVVVGMRAVPDLPFWLGRLAGSGEGDAVHRLYLLVLPLVLVPTALFGAAFPVLIRICARGAAGAGEGIGVATAVNTAGSILASLAVGFWWIPSLGMDRSLLLLLALDGAVALAALVGFQRATGWRWAASVLGAAAVIGAALLSFDGVQVDRAIAGQALHAATLAEYRGQLDRELASQRYRAEGRAAVVTVYVQPTQRLLRTNGLPEAGYAISPPYYPAESMWLGILPFLAAGGEPERALLVGLGGGNTLDSLLATPLAQIDVVELEREVVDALPVFAQGRPSPLDDPRVRVVVNDGRNELRVAALDGRARYDVIASQPSHPWRIGAANLFTEEYFELAHAVLSEGGRFALWVNGFRLDRESLLAIAASFDRVFPGALLFDVSHDRARRAFLFLGGRAPLVLDPEAIARRLREPRLAELLARFGLGSLPAVLAGFEGPVAAFAALAPGARNTDDDAFVETRVPRRRDWSYVDFAAIEAELPAGVPALPPLAAPLAPAAVARLILDAHAPGKSWVFGPRLERLLANQAAADAFASEWLLAEARLREPARREEALAALRRLAAEHPERPEPLRTLGRDRWAYGDAAGAAQAFAAAWDRSGAPEDAFGAGRALIGSDPKTGWAWLERIPEAERARYPELAYHAAQRALARGARPEEPAATREELRAAYDALRVYRDTREGRENAAVNELLARLAWSLGDPQAARGYADLARDGRRSRSLALAGRARRALDAGRLDEAEALAAEAERYAPSDRDVLALRARVALARRDPAALGAALARLREWAPSLEQAVLGENRFRQEAGLPLLPERSLEALLAEPPPLPPPAR
jgi:spermidine synthase